MSKKTVGSLKNGVLSLTGDVNERYPVLGGFLKHRYVREHMNGSSQNIYNHITEVQVFDEKGTNVAHGKTLTTDDGTAIEGVAKITDGALGTTSSTYAAMDTGSRRWILDLGEPVNISEIKIWHYYTDNRTYKDLILDVSPDGVHWYNVYDAAVHGSYAETDAGKTHKIPKFGLAVSFPFDNSLKGTKCISGNLVNNEGWKLGEGFSTQYKDWTISGTASENAIVMKENPWGGQEISWASLTNDTDATSADGGFFLKNLPVDPTKKYRASIWVRRENSADGNMYFGPTANTVTSLGSTTANDNPYFVSYNKSSVPYQDNNWVLLVYYIFPHDYTGTTLSTESGIYQRNGERQASGIDFKWVSSITTAGIRSYKFYCSDPTDRHYLMRPRLELVDGTEPTIEDLLYGFDEAYNTVSTGEPNEQLSNEYGYNVENSRTNIAVSSKSVRPITYNNRSGNMTIRNTDKTYRGQPVYIWSYIPDTDAQVNGLKGSVSGDGVRSPISLTFKANTKYSSSIYYRPITDPDMKCNGAPTNISNWNVRPNVELEDGWNLACAYRDGTVTANATDYAFYGMQFPSAEIGRKIEVEICGLMVTEGTTYATSPFVGTVGRAELRIPIQLKPPFTINLFHTPNAPLSEITTQQTSCKILQLGVYYSNASFSLWNFTKNLQYFIKGDTGSAWSDTGGTITYTDEQWNNKEHMYTVVYETTKLIKIYLDGELIGTRVPSGAATVFNDIIFSPEANNSSQFRDLNVFNIALSETQIKSLNKPSFGITMDGNLNSQIIERPDAPEGGYYFPLATDTYEVNGEVKAAFETNLKYGDGGAWIAPPHGNRYECPDYTLDTNAGGWSFWGSTGVVGEYAKNTNRDFIYSPERQYSMRVKCDKTSTQNYLMYQSPTGPANPHSLKAIIRMADGSEVTDSKVYPSWNQATGDVSPGKWSNITPLGDSGWYLCEVKRFAQDGTNNLVGIYVKIGNEIYVDKIQVTDLAYDTPFAETPQSAYGLLQFNLNRDIGFDWSKNWTICYWKMPKGTDSQLAGYNIETLGVYANLAASKGYRWLGKKTSSNSNQNPPYDFEPSKYFQNWHMIALTHNATTKTLTYRSYSEAYGKRTHSESINIPSADFFVTAGEYDLDLSGVHDSKSYSKVCKDLLVYKKVLTEAEIDGIYNNQMSFADGKLRVQNSVSIL